MADHSNRIMALIAESRAGSAAAANELFAVYGPHVLRAVRRQLPNRLRRLFDSLDIVQDVWKSFFDLHPHRWSFDSPLAFQKFLARLASNKVKHAYRHALAQKRDLRREEPLGAESQDGEGCGAALRGRERTPSEAAMSREARAGLQDLPAGAFPRIAEWLRQGFSHKEVAEKAGISVRELRRVIRAEIMSRPAWRQIAQIAPRTRRAAATMNHALDPPQG